MTLKNIIAAILITLGFVVLAYSGISFTTPGETVQFLGLRIETTHTHFIPPIVGAEVVPLAEPGGPLHGARGTTSRSQGDHFTEPGGPLQPVANPQCKRLETPFVRRPLFSNIWQISSIMHHRGSSHLTLVNQLLA